MSRVGPVYTPPGHRRHGYGAAVTAAAARWASDAGARQVVLFVDEANPTTNRLYPRLGFRPVHEVVELSFEPPAPGRRDRAVTCRNRYARECRSRSGMCRTARPAGGRGRVPGRV